MVTTVSAFQMAIEGTAARVIHVSGELTGAFRIGSNKTNIGVCGAILRGSVAISGSNNANVDGGASALAGERDGRERPGISSVQLEPFRREVVRGCVAHHHLAILKDQLCPEPIEGLRKHGVAARRSHEERALRQRKFRGGD